MVAGEGDFRQWEDGTKGREPEGRKGRGWVALDRGSCRAYISGMIFAVTYSGCVLRGDLSEVYEFAP